MLLLFRCVGVAVGGILLEWWLQSAICTIHHLRRSAHGTVNMQKRAYSSPQAPEHTMYVVQQTRRGCQTGINVTR